MTRADRVRHRVEGSVVTRGCPSPVAPVTKGRLKQGSGRTPICYSSRGQGEARVLALWHAYCAARKVGEAVLRPHAFELPFLETTPPPANLIVAVP